MSITKNIYATIDSIPSKVSELENDSVFLTPSTIPIALILEDWTFELIDGNNITKTIPCAISIAQEDFIFELEDGTTISKMVVVQ